MDLKNKSRSQLNALWRINRSVLNELLYNDGALEAIRECERDMERIREELYLRDQIHNQPKEDLYINLYALLAQLYITIGSNMHDGGKHINTSKP